MKKIMKRLAILMVILAVVSTLFAVSVSAAEETTLEAAEGATTEISEDVTEAETKEDFSYLGGVFSAERWVFAGEMVAVGMLMVFSVLAILWLIFAITGKIFNREKKPKRTKKTIEATDGATEIRTPDAAAPDLTEKAVMADGELVAIITAAVAATIESGDYPELQSGFRVVSFKRTGAVNSRNR